jgi:hypothetical protein
VNEKTFICVLKNTLFEKNKSDQVQSHSFADYKKTRKKSIHGALTKNRQSMLTNWNRATRLGEFSHIGRLFTLDSVLKITKVAQFWGILFPRYQLCINFEQKMGWATFWAIFSQTHLVTLNRKPKQHYSRGLLRSYWDARKGIVLRKNAGQLLPAVVSYCKLLQPRLALFVTGLPDFPWYNIPKRGKIYQVTIK